MSMALSRPMSILRVDFADLYARHLCRHSQVGINVVHLASLFGTWFGVYGIVYSLVHVEWMPIAMAAIYLALIALSAPPRVCLASAVFLGLFVGMLLWLPEFPIWVYALMIPLFYKVQSWSHKIWTKSTDMTDFNNRYPKGFGLFIVLLINEAPICLNRLMISFHSRSHTPPLVMNSLLPERNDPVCR
jgi:hypothetical protein